MNSLAIEILADLVAFPTESSATNLELIDYIREYLAKHKVSSELVFSEDQQKANLFATIGPQDRSGIAFSGHTDVVPVSGQNWSHPPYSLTFSEGKLIARGSCDMKGFIACCLAMVPEMTRFPLQCPIHFAFSYDEEVGCLGVRGMIEQLGKSLLQPQLIWVGEPTEMQVVIAHKSIMALTVQVIGKACHSSLYNQGVSAIEQAHRIIGYIYQLRDAGVAAATTESGTLAAAQPQQFDPPFTTMHVGLINGGTAMNVVAPECNFTLDIRGLPDVDCAAIVADIENWSTQNCLPAMQQLAPGSRINFQRQSSVPAFAMPLASVEDRFAKRIVGNNSYQVASYVTEAGLFQAAGIPTILCGPGSISEAHQANEFISPEQMQHCLYMIRHIIELCRASTTPLL